MIPALVSLEQAILQVKPADDADFDLQVKLAEASGIVMNYMKLTEIPDEWIITESPETDEVDDPAVVATDGSPAVLILVPANVRSAVLLVLTELYENRLASTSDPISSAVISLLTPYRDPTFA